LAPGWSNRPFALSSPTFSSACHSAVAPRAPGREHRGSPPRCTPIPLRGALSTEAWLTFPWRTRRGCGPAAPNMHVSIPAIPQRKRGQSSAPPHQPGGVKVPPHKSTLEETMASSLTFSTSLPQRKTDLPCTPGWPLIWEPAKAARDSHPTASKQTNMALKPGLGLRGADGGPVSRARTWVAQGSDQLRGGVVHRPGEPGTSLRLGQGPCGWPGGGTQRLSKSRRGQRASPWPAWKSEGRWPVRRCTYMNTRRVGEEN